MKNETRHQHSNPEVEMWMNRALAAEKELREERERAIANHPEINYHYKSLLNRIFG